MVEQSLKGIIFLESARRRGDTDRCDTEHVLPSLSVFALASPNPPPRREAQLELKWKTFIPFLDLMQNPITVEKKGEIGEKPTLPDHLGSKTIVQHGPLSMLQMMMLQKQHRNCPNSLKY